jgi:hypothetical protein
MAYLSGVCAESPVQARLCNPGEQGSVVTVFPNFHESKPYAWNIVPFNLYIEGTTTPGQRLLYGSRSIKVALAENARSGYLWGVCEGTCPLNSDSFWPDLIAATIERDVFLFAVKTTREQDEMAVQWINSQSNVNHYNAVMNNCAMFVRALVNTIFPHAVHRDMLNDIGIMSPKAAARSFSRWAHKRPELGFYCMHFEQKPGNIRRSGTASSGTEAAIHIKKYFIPAALIGDHEIAGSFLLTYLLTGRFSLYKEYAHYPSSELTSLEAKRKDASEDDDSQEARAIEDQILLKRAEINGTDKEWEAYRQRFTELTRIAEADTSEKKAQIKKLLDSGSASVDEHGDVWLTCKEDKRRVGIVNTNVLAKESDPELAFDLLMWRIGYALKTNKRMRPSMAVFHQDWALFEQAYERLLSSEAASGDKVRLIQGSGPKSR